MLPEFFDVTRELDLYMDPFVEDSNSESDDTETDSMQDMTIINFSDYLHRVKPMQRLLLFCYSEVLDDEMCFETTMHLYDLACFFRSAVLKKKL